MLLVSDSEMTIRAVVNATAVSPGMAAGVVAAHSWADHSYRTGRDSGAKLASECVIGGSVRHGEQLTATEESINWCGEHATD